MNVRQVNIAVIGLGYVGLPLAIHFSTRGFSVIGIDIDKQKIDSLAEGKSYIPDVSDSSLQNAISKGLFTASTPEKSIVEFKQASYIIVTVPTPVSNGDPNLTAMISASNFIQRELQNGQTVIYESSTYPGTLEEVILPILQKSGKEVGKDYYLGYSPERIDPRNDQFPLGEIPKVVSGQTLDCRDKVISLYEQIFDNIVPVSSPKVAEMCKLFENIQRLVNISLVNETFSLCRIIDVDFYEVLQAASTKPFGFTPYWPGPGIGGHCIPVDPLYFQWKLKQHGLTSELIQAAMEVNEKMPFEIVQRVNDFTGKVGTEVFLIGLTYKKDVNDLRESPALKVFSLLVEKGYNVSYFDPYFPSITINGTKYQAKEISKKQLNKANLIVILTDHSEVDWKLVLEEGKAIIDTRGVLHSFGKRGYL